MGQQAIIALVGAGAVAGGILWQLADSGAENFDWLPINENCRVHKDDGACGLDANGCYWYKKYFTQEGCYDVGPDDPKRWISYGLIAVGVLCLFQALRAPSVKDVKKKAGKGYYDWR